MKSSTTPEALTARAVASDLMIDERVMEATLVLTDVIPLSQALMITATPPAPKIGDILYTSWGYDQTNIDWYQVVKVSKASIWVREIRAARIGTTRTQDEMSPLHGQFTTDKVTMHRFRPGWENPHEYTANIDGHTGWLWDGRPRHQTASGYGH